MTNFNILQFAEKPEQDKAEGAASHQKKQESAVDEIIKGVQSTVDQNDGLLLNEKMFDKSDVQIRQ